MSAFIRRAGVIGAPKSDEGHGPQPGARPLASDIRVEELPALMTINPSLGPRNHVRRGTALDFSKSTREASRDLPVAGYCATAAADGTATRAPDGQMRRDAPYSHPPPRSKGIWTLPVVAAGGPRLSDPSRKFVSCDGHHPHVTPEHPRLNEKDEVECDRRRTPAPRMRRPRRTNLTRRSRSLSSPIIITRCPIAGIDATVSPPRDGARRTACVTHRTPSGRHSLTAHNTDHW